LYYRQTWRDDTVILKAGQLAADDDFMGSSYTGLFANSAFGAMPSQVGNRLAGCCGFSPAFPIYPVAAPGVFLSLQPVESSFYAQAGVYYGRPGMDTPSNYGFDWVSQTPPQAGIFFEGGYRYKIAQRAAVLRLGGSYNTGRLEDFAAMNVGHAGVTRQSVPNFYAVHDLELLHGAGDRTVLGLFCRAGVTPEPERSMVAAYADGGLNWFGPVPGRREDVAGVGVSYSRFGREFREATGPNGVADSETALEIAYKAQITRWFSLQADVQLLFNPAARPGAARETAKVFGLRARVNF
jgi:porin